MAKNYWDQVLNRRLSRRRAVLGSGALTASAAFLVACGSDDDGTPATTGGTTGGGSTGTAGTVSTGGATGATGGAGISGLITQPTYTGPTQAKRGGVFKDFAQGAVESIDPYSGQRGLNDIADKIFSSLLTEEPGKLEESQHVLKGDLAESWEVSPDGLQATLNLRQGVKWHNIDPVNGRAFDASDVMASMDRYKEIGNLGALIFNDRGPAGFVQSYESPDDATVIVNFTEPLAWALSWFAPFGGYTSTFMIVSREAANGDFNADQQMIGTGPFYLGQYDPGIRFVLQRNEDYWDPDWALVDTIEMPIIPEYAQLQAQLKAGNIYWARDPRIVRPTDTLQTREDQPDLLLYAGERVVGTSVLTYGVEPFLDGGVNPFEDERVRQALSYAYDRDLDIDVQYNVKEFADAGLPVDVWWNSHMSQRPDFSGGGWVLDPRDESFGENAKYFHYSVKEAKALLSAAGYPDGFELPFRYPHAPAFSRETRVEPLFFYFQEIGLTVAQSPMTDYIGDYIPNNRDAGGQYPGIGFHSITAGIPSSVDPTASLYAEHHPANTVTFHGYNNGEGDPVLVEILTKAKGEQDAEARKALAHEAQRHLGKAQWCMIESGAASGFHLIYPAVANARVYSSAPSTWDHYQLWIDDTKAPLA
jgi:ABC-type transport system substrate-binding protein